MAVLLYQYILHKTFFGANFIFYSISSIITGSDTYLFLTHLFVTIIIIIYFCFSSIVDYL
jgi:hypothetical protein